MVGQPPLPLLPGEAIAIGSAAGLLEEESSGAVFIWGNVAYCWDASDEAARRFAAVQLVLTKTAKPGQVASAFGVGSTTLWRWQRDFAEAGLAGLLEAKRGPKRARLVTEDVAEVIKALRAKGKSLREIAAAVGLSTYPVRQTLGLLARPGSGPARSIDSDEALESDAAISDDEVATDEAISDDEVATDEAISDDEVATGEVADDEVVRVLEPLARPEPREAERALAHFGMLVEAKPVFTEGAGLPRLGALLILPALEATGLIDAAHEVYRHMRNGFYGLTSTILTMVFLALAREPRAEGATRIPPADLGRLLGLDRAPEVKTIRRKLAELARRGLGSRLVAGLAARHAKADPEALGYLYIDGHVRVYAGKRDLQKAHVTRTRTAAPPTTETWVNDTRGDPVFVVTSEPSASLVSEIRRLLSELRSLLGDRRATVVFDRGGWSPGLFAEMVEAGFDFLTYRKGKVRAEPAGAFSTHTYVEDGVTYTYDLADRRVRLRLPKKVAGRKTLDARQVVRRTDNGHQTQIVTSRLDPAAADVAYRMFSRWRQENYFRYARAHFALDGLDSYAAAPDDPERSVPNPARKVLQAKLRKARATLAAADAALGVAAAQNAESKRRTMRGFKIANADLTRAAREARAEVTRLEVELSSSPTRLPLAEVRPEATLLDEERKLLTHAIRMATYNAESALARMLVGHFPMDEARALLREAFNSAGDLEVRGATLEVRLDPLSAPRRTRALAALCEELTATETTYPGTKLVLRYSVKERPGIA